eukprot:CAMPEP_0170077848 /NCGR_PEP_ID=MMETSP0019_2-20121128/14569_1 /TAXON_ID=98059 /ORGANISM="Dinobryon sp., Strain UTEXLB2267" /LENGTH=175 /DNA_ID=CAMNT_0010290395 /DNA_START=151 /DNA_END=678 /DNA_ORIENTATION=+
MRTEKFKEVRMYFRESRIYLGKNTIAQIALGRSPEEEYKCNLSKISEKLVGNVGLLFTNRPRKEVVRYFENFSHPDFAKAGAIATETFILEPQPLPQFPVSMLNELRKMGMAVEIDDGTVMLREPVTVMSDGVPLTPEQARMLVKLDRKTITFQIRMECVWLEKGSKFIELAPAT